MTVKELLGQSVLLSLFMGSVALANEVDGFRLGMSMAKVRQLAVERGYAFSNPIKPGSGRWLGYVLEKDGPALWFCDVTLSGVSLQRPSSFEEVVATIKIWRSAYGEPQVLPSIYYSPQGTQHDAAQLRWLGEDNIRRDISISQIAQMLPDITLGYSYIKHPCRP